VNPESLDAFDRATCAVVRDVFLETLKQHRGTYYAHRLAKLTLFFVDSASANALALERRMDCGVAVYLGLIRRLWATFQLGLSLPEFLDGAFDDPPGAPPSGSLDALVSGQTLAMLPGEDWPLERVGALWDLFERAITFLVCHELAHHARGHLDLVRDHLGFDGIDELRATASAGPESLLMRMVEFDADVEAVDLILIAVKARAERESWSLGKSESQGFQWMVAAATLFLVFDLEHLPIERQYQGSHPAPIHRSILAMSAFSRAFRRQFGWSEERQQHLEHVAWDAVGAIGEALSFPEGRWVGSPTQLADLQRFDAEEREFLKFEAWLNVTGDSVPEPDWLTALPPIGPEGSA
jgi:hypothetical protein